MAFYIFKIGNLFTTIGIFQTKYVSSISGYVLQVVSVLFRHQTKYMKINLEKKWLNGEYSKIINVKISS